MSNNEKQTPFARKIEKVPLPLMIEHHLNVSLSMDFFYINEIYSSTLSPIKLISFKHNTARLDNLEQSWLVQKLYQKNTGRSSIITNYHLDNEFDKVSLKDVLTSSTLHIYVEEVNMQVQLSDPRSQSREDVDQYVKVSHIDVSQKLMIRALIEAIIYILSFFPSTDQIDKTMIPYALVYSATNNTMISRAAPVKSLQMLNNVGGH